MTAQVLRVNLRFYKMHAAVKKFNHISGCADYTRLCQHKFAFLNYNLF